MALVELYRTIGEARYLTLARRLVEARGHGLLGEDRFGAAYWQDHAPVREAAYVAGHAVRQMYLDCGAVDLAVETGDDELLQAVIRRWNDMTATRTYLTGGIGSRHRDESFGDPFELPPDLAYAETCAAIGSFLLGWRLLLATGDERFADHMERAIYNAILPGVSLEGDEFFYVNPLQRRRRFLPSGGPDVAARQPWFACACCPPNLMRLFASLEHYLASADDTGVQIHQIAPCTLRIGPDGGDKVLRIATDYPWHGTVSIRVVESPAGAWRLRVRRPSWAVTGRASVGNEEFGWPTGPFLDLERVWQSGDELKIEFDMTPRYVAPDPRIDAIRGCNALERGPLVYCFEEVDLPDNITLDDVTLLRDVPPGVDFGPSAIPGVVSIRSRMATHERPSTTWPYHPQTESPRATKTATLDAIAVPYFAWGNRGLGGMRVWIPGEVGRAAPAAG
jgi:DUF1680 family protein